MSSDAQKAELLERLAERTDLSEAERAALREAAARFRAAEKSTPAAAARRPSRSERRAQRDSKEPPPSGEGGMAILWSDGAARGNPGLAGAGAVLRSPDGELLAECSRFLGQATNNIAEYEAVLLGIQRALELGVQKLEIRADSELLIKQLRGEYRVRHEGLKPLYERAKQLLERFRSVRLVHVRREHNSDADRLANLAIDSRG